MSKKTIYSKFRCRGYALYNPRCEKSIRRVWKLSYLYTKYAKELKELIEGKEVYTSGMTHEIERCNQAIEYARSGKTTCIISNGDANVFGMGNSYS